MEPGGGGEEGRGREERERVEGIKKGGRRERETAIMVVIEVLCTCTCLWKSR